ncbi:MAG: dihydroxy-acid dehydratase, partial [Sulfurovum sp.]|nr:dihydroxy-acid dehydratase [Sulfurovum sp.]
IHIDVDNYILEAKLSDKEIAQRKASFKPLVKPLKSKWLKQYRALVTNASSGAVLEAE